MNAFTVHVPECLLSSPGVIGCLDFGCVKFPDCGFGRCSVFRCHGHGMIMSFHDLGCQVHGFSGLWMPRSLGFMPWLPWSWVFMTLGAKAISDFGCHGHGFS